jgi:hypothetical protein
MVASITQSDAGQTAFLSTDADELVARLTQAAYEVALRHRSDRPFTGLELALRRELRTVVRRAAEGE